MRFKDYAAVKQALDGLHRKLLHLDASAASSLAEGLDETLTVHRLLVPQQLREYAAILGVLRDHAFSVRGLPLPSWSTRILHERRH